MKNTRITYPTYQEYSIKVAESQPLCGGYRMRGQVLNKSDIPLVSIITVTFNAEKTLHQTLHSVKEQTYKNIEHIIVDGGSTDSTLSLIQANEANIAYWRSEKDHGIYDAFNKGVVLAKGEFIGILNADDYYEPNQIENAVSALIKTDAPFVHGDIILHGWKGLDVELLGDPHYELRIREGMPSLHQVTTLCRRSVYEDFGLFSTQYRIASDYDWYLRLCQHGCIGTHVPTIRAHMNAGGVSTTQQRRSLFEVFLISWRHGLGLKRALVASLPRIVFPNGTPMILTRLLIASNHPLTALSNLLRRIMVLDKTTNQDKLAKECKQSVLQAFIAARHITLEVHPLGLEWIYGVGLRSRTFISLSQSPEAKAAELLLEASGADRIAELEEADVVIVDQKQAEDMQIGQYLERKTVLMTLFEGSIRSSYFAFPSLDFGGIIGYGFLINPILTLREINHE